MKQLRWVWVLGIAAVLLTGIFLIVDHVTKEKEAEKQIGGPQQLFQINSDLITRLTVDNEEGHFAFDWDAKEGEWQIVSQEQFDINTYAIAAICNYFCKLSSVKTVAFDCEDTSVYGFDHPITLKLYTSDPEHEEPYVLLIGDSTPTYDAYYAMLENSNDVYTIDYNSGSIFCAAKDTLKNTYLMDVTSSHFDYYRLERGGKTVTEFGRTADYSWELRQPAGFEYNKIRIDELVDTVIRIQYNRFIEEHPDDLAKYGLDQPKSKVFLEGTRKGKKITKEFWFGKSVDSTGLEVYGYLKETEQVFTVMTAEISFTEYPAEQYIASNCINVSISDLQSIDVDMGDIYDMKETLHLDYANTQYSLGDIDITALNDDKIMGLFNAYYRSITLLSFTELDLDAKPDPEAEPEIRILYTFLDGHTTELTFTEKEKNNFYLFRDGSYTGMTVRLNQFSNRGCMTEAYEALKTALQ